MRPYRVNAGSYAIITGASSGLGAVFAEAFAGRGQKLILVARSADKLEALANDLRGRFPVEIEVVALDLSKPDSAQKLFEATHGKSVTTLVNNAGVAVTGAFGEGDANDVQSMMVLNTQTPTALIGLYLPQLKAAHGAIVNVASHAAFQPVPFMAAYAASKAYVLHFSEALREELRPDGVRVLAVCPGATDTGFWAAAKMDPATTQFVLQSPKFVVDDAMNALDHDRSSTIAGFKNNLTSFAGRFASRDVVTRLARKMVGH